MEKTRLRLVYVAGGFVLMFAAVAAKLAVATVIFPVLPHRVEPITRLPVPGTPAESDRLPISRSDPPRLRAMITDRNGQMLAVSLPTAALYADPREITDPAEAARGLKQAVPRLDEAMMLARLSELRHFVYLARPITPQEELAINDLGIPGISFQPTERRLYPLGREVARILGRADTDEDGIAGVEKAFDQRLRDDPSPLRLSLDVRVQAILRDAVTRTVEKFQALGGCAIVMDARDSRLLGVVSIPDFDASNFASADSDSRFDRCITGTYEPGSVFKLQTIAMALDDQVIHVWDQFDTINKLHVGRYTFADFEQASHRLYVPEILAESSDIGAGRIALLVGAERQRSWLERMGMFTRTAIELPEAARPQVQSERAWREVTTVTVSFGNGIAVTPLHLVTSVAAMVNGGIFYPPTLLAAQPGGPPRQGTRVMRLETSDLMRKLMRLVVTSGTGKAADVPGYFVGGKTGTSQKTSGHGYRKHTNLASFIAAFPINDPQYVVYMMIDAPKATANTHGFTTGGWIAAPAVGEIISQIGPMLGLLPETRNAAAIRTALALPLQPGRPPGIRPQVGAPPVNAATGSRAPRQIGPSIPASPLPATPVMPSHPMAPQQAARFAAARDVIR